MIRKKVLLAGVCLGFGTAAAVPAVQGQSCTSSQDAAVQCFVDNTVRTSLTRPHFGMSLVQFQSYGVAISHILQTRYTYLTLIGTASAIADAMPPTNADGSPNKAAQDVAVAQIVSSEVKHTLAGIMPGAELQDLVWFSMDVVDAMNVNNGYMQLLTPGVALRIIDSYIVSATSNGAVNWTQVNESLSAAIDQMIAAGLIKVPPSLSPANLKLFVEALAKSIYEYKVSTNRAHL